MSDPLEDFKQIAAGIAGRMRALVLTLDRLDRLEAGTGTWLDDFNNEELPSAATEITLRALQAATRAENYNILQQLAAQPAISMRELGAAVSQDRLGLSERLNDLIQVGLASREIDTDQAQITPSGADMVKLVNGISEQVAKEYLSKREK